MTRSAKKDSVELVNFLVLSEKRKNVLLLLREGPKTLYDIRTSLGVTSSGIIPQLRKMEERDLIYQKGKSYALTDIGWLISKSFYNFYGLVNVIEENKYFWEEHDITAIPEGLLMRLHELGEYNVYESNPTDMEKPHREYIKNLLSSNWVRGVSPVLHPEYPKAINTLGQRGADVSLIMTEEVFERIKKDHTPELKEGLRYDNVRFFICKKDVGIAFTVSDVFLSMRLFRLKDGSYDFYRNIISYERSAINKWGEDLFKHFEKDSELIEQAP